MRTKLPWTLLTLATIAVAFVTPLHAGSGGWYASASDSDPAVAPAPPAPPAPPTLPTRTKIVKVTTTGEGGDPQVYVYDDGDDDAGAGAGAEAEDDAGSTDKGKHERHMKVLSVPVKRGFLGVAAIEMTPELREYYGAPKEAGVLVGRLVDQSPASRSGLRVGDIVTSVDGHPVESPSDLASEIGDHKQGDQVVLDVWRDRKALTITSKVDERQREVVDLGPTFWRSPKDGKGIAFRFDDKRMKEIMEQAEKALEDAKVQADVAEKLHPRAKSQADIDARMRELEEKLRELDEKLRQQDQKLRDSSPGKNGQVQ